MSIEDQTLDEIRMDAAHRITDYFENYTDDGESFSASGSSFVFTEYGIVAGVAAEPLVREIERLRMYVDALENDLRESS